MNYFYHQKLNHIQLKKPLHKIKTILLLLLFLFITSIFNLREYSWHVVFLQYLNKIREETF